ncbi:MAG: galactokinase, partial [Thermoleophilaceae bacterium]|nr:galactokinase [Thermoleophilaceae bacterium]
GDSIEAHAVDLGESDRFPVGDPPPSEGWRAFVRGVAAELDAPAARLSIHGTVPLGSGLSSSAALSVSLCLALLGLCGADEGADRLELARLCSRVENEWVGAQTGLLDQIASLFGVPGAALRVDFRSLDVQPVPLRLGDWSLVLVDSGDEHSNAAAGGYNERRRECADAAAQLGVELVSDASRSAAEALPGRLRRRVLHVLDENERVDAAVGALRSDDMPRLGRLLDESHTSMRDQYDASTDAVERTVRRLKDGGAAGARMMGGGFGGHVLALLPPGAPQPDGARSVAPGPGARVLERG